MPRIQRIAAALAVWGWWPGTAHAHAFESGADLYAQFLEGAGVVLAYPPSLLPLIALGILLTLWRTEGMLAALPWYAGGLVLGIGLAPLTGAWILYLLLALGIAAGLLAALAPRLAPPLLMGLALALGAGTTAVGLEGHGFLQLPALIHIGVLFGAYLALAVSAGIVRLTLERISAHWLRLAWRILASWVVAILTLYAAFSVAGQA